MFTAIYCVYKHLFKKIKQNICLNIIIYADNLKHNRTEQGYAFIQNS